MENGLSIRRVTYGSASAHLGGPTVRCAAAGPAPPAAAAHPLYHEGSTGSARRGSGVYLAPSPDSRMMGRSHSPLNIRKTKKHGNRSHLAHYKSTMSAIIDAPNEETLLLYSCTMSNSLSQTDMKPDSDKTKQERKEETEREKKDLIKKKKNKTLTSSVTPYQLMYDELLP
eukprot:gene7688-5393_t